jgi:L-galactose dehydrogenase/L-glyceraldehyde 3-phosphate reductase
MIEQRALGGTGLAVSALGFGCGAVGGLMVRGDPTAQRRAVEQAIAAGVRYFDTAPSYGDGLSETHLGRVLSQVGDQAGDLVVGTKFRVDSTTASQGAAAVRQAVRVSLEASLRRLRRDRVHLFQLHNRIVVEDAPPAVSGSLTAEQVLGPVAEAMRAMRDAGLTEHVGITATGDPAAVRRVVDADVPAAAQVYFNALNPSAGWAGKAGAGGQDLEGLIDTAAARQVGVIVIRPLAAGAVAGVTARHPNAGGTGGIVGEDYAADVARAGALGTLAASLGLEGPVELAFRFALSKPGVSTVLIGFSDEAQLADALRWATRGPLPEGALQDVLALTR